MTQAIELDLAAYVSPGMELIYENASDDFRGHWPRVEEYLSLIRPNRQIGDRHNAHLSIRHLGASGTLKFAQDKRSADHPYPFGMLHDNPAARENLLAAWGIEKQVLHPGPTLLNVRHLPVDLGVNILEGYNRYVAKYVRSAPDRLRYVIQLHAHAPNWSKRELEKYAQAPGAAGASICFPAAVPVDSRELDPIWEYLNRHELPLFHRQAISAPVWTPRRFLYVMSTERICERNPNMPIVFIESGSHWLCPIIGNSPVHSHCHAGPVNETMLQSFRKLSNRIIVSVTDTDISDTTMLDQIFQSATYGFETRMPFEVYA